MRDIGRTVLCFKFGALNRVICGWLAASKDDAATILTFEFAAVDVAYYRVRHTTMLEAVTSISEITRSADIAKAVGCHIALEHCNETFGGFIWV